MDHLFTSSALGAVSDEGILSLPAFICRILERRSDSSSLVIGRHPVDPCLTAYDRGHMLALHEDHERQRRSDPGADAHHARARRTFGMAEETPWGESGLCRLPSLMRRIGGIEDLALFVGAGATFEIWNPRKALESDDEAVRELAAWRLGDSLPYSN